MLMLGQPIPNIFLLLTLMPNYIVVRCANDQCTKFQTQQEKKSNKWACVVCGLKQSLKRVYLQSTAPKECRAAVMDLNMNCGLSREAKEQAISIARNQLPPPSENRSNTNMDTIYPSVSKWTEYIDEDGSNVNEATVLPDQELDKHNRVVFGRVEQKQPAKKKSKLAEVSNRPHVRPKAAQQARYSPYNIDRSSNAASGSASKDTQKLSDALMSLTQKANRTNPTPVSKNVTIHTHEKPLKLPVKQQQTSSKWQEFDNDSSSEDEID